MITDTEIRTKGLEALINALGEVDAERFISLVMREPFDYTKWHRSLWADESVTEISKHAMQFRKNNEAKKIIPDKVE
jgi:hypothetical protein